MRKKANICTEREAVEPLPPRTPARGALPPCARSIPKPKKQKNKTKTPKPTFRTLWLLPPSPIMSWELIFCCLFVFWTPLAQGGRGRSEGGRTVRQPSREGGRGEMAVGKDEKGVWGRGHVG